MLDIRGVETFYGRHPGVARRRYRSLPRRDRDPDRGHRRRQVDPADDGVRRSPGGGRPDHAGRRRYHPQTDLRDRAHGPRPGPGRPAHLPAYDSAGESSARCDHRRRRAFRGGHRPGSTNCSRFCGTAPTSAAARFPVAASADAGDRPGADEPAAPAPARRTLARPRADDRQADFRGRGRDQQDRHHGLPGRAERLSRAAGWPTAAMLWPTAGSC